MGCNCGKKTITQSYVSLDTSGNPLPNNPEHDLLEKTILTTTAREGKVTQNIVNLKGEVVGYILFDEKTRTSFSIFRNQVLQKK